MSEEYLNVVYSIALELFLVRFILDSAGCNRDLLRVRPRSVDSRSYNFICGELVVHVQIFLLQMASAKLFSRQ